MGSGNKRAADGVLGADVSRHRRGPGRRRRTVADQDADDQADAGLDPEAQLVQQQTVEQVRRALGTLPTDFREVLVLREL